MSGVSGMRAADNHEAATGHNLPFKKPRNLPFERLQYSGI